MISSASSREAGMSTRGTGKSTRGSKIADIIQTSGDRDGAKTELPPPSSASESAPAPAPALPAAPIEYDRSLMYVTRRQRRVLMTLTLINMKPLDWLIFAPNTSPHIKAKWRQWQAKRELKARLRQDAADQQQSLDYA